RLVSSVREQMQVPVTILDFFDAATITQQAEVVEKLQIPSAEPRKASTLIPIRATGTRTPLFCAHAIEGGVYIYQNLIPYLDPELPVYGLQAVGMDGTEPPLENFDDISAHHVKQIRSVQPHGPYYLCGYSMGGRVAMEIADLLRKQGETEVYVMAIDSVFKLRLPRWMWKLPAR